MIVAFKVLIIQLTRMGDIIQTLPLIKRLREEIPKVYITFLCVDRFAEILTATPMINRYIKITPQEALKIKNMDASSLYAVLEHPFLKEHYDLVINLTHDLSSAIISGRIKATERTGAVAEDSSSPYLKLKDKWGRYLFSCVNNREENSFNLVDIHMGMGKVHPCPVSNYLGINSKNLERIERIFLKFGISKEQPVVALHIGANKLHRTWPVEHFAALSEFLIKHYNARIILTGSSAEEHLFNNFIYHVNPERLKHGQVINLIGKTRLQDLIALIGKCSLLVSNDTGPIHIAASVGTPTVGIYTSTAYPGETAPYGEGHYVIHPLMSCYPCIDEHLGFDCGLPCRYSILPEKVFEVASGILENRSKDLKKGEDVMILRSRFLSNGTLLYEPAIFPRDFSDEVFQKWLRKIMLRMVWEGVLGLPSDPLLIYRIPEEDVKRWIIKAEAILDSALDSLQSNTFAETSTLKSFSGLFLDFSKLSIYSDCSNEIPETIFLMKQRLKEISSWSKRAFRSA